MRLNSSNKNEEQVSLVSARNWEKFEAAGDGFEQCNCVRGQTGHFVYNYCNITCLRQQYQKIGASSSLLSGRKMDNKKLVNLKICGAIFFVFASIFCMYQLWLMHPYQPKGPKQIRHLKMVNMFQRHGDRSPSDHLPQGDRHREMEAYFWPNGLTNLTDIGRLRMSKIGLETRQRYKHYIGYDSSEILALSSSVNRCVESMEHFLQGFYNNEQTKNKGRRLISEMMKRRNEICSATSNGIDKHCHHSQLPNGSGYPNEWLKVQIDSQFLPTLTYEFLNDCHFRKVHPSPIDKNLLVGPEIRKLPHVGRLKSLLKERYNQEFNFHATGVWSTVASELNLVRTESNLEYTDHFRDWINEPVIQRGDSVITLFDLYEQVCVLTYRDRLVDEANYIQSGTLLTSMIESQLVAIGQNVTTISESANIYTGKKMIIYLTHDSILQRLLFTIGLIQTKGSFEDRFFKWSEKGDYDGNQLGKYLDGLKMSSYGSSVRFELTEVEQEGQSDRVHVVQAFIYNREDADLAIKFELVEFGAACRMLFNSKYPGANLNQFYPQGFHLDQNNDCPLKLLTNITAELRVNKARIKELCVDK